MKMMLIAILAAAPFAASATTYGVGGVAAGAVYQGTAAGYTSSVSTGGSQALAETQGTGYAVQGAASATNGISHASGYAAPVSAVSNSGFTSFSVAGSGGFQGGNGSGSSSAGGGTDVGAGAGASFQVKSFGVGGFTGFSW